MVFDFYERTVQAHAFGRCEEGHQLAYRLALFVVYGLLFKEERDVHIESFGDLTKPTRADAVDPLFVLLELLEGDTNSDCDVFLADVE